MKKPGVNCDGIELISLTPHSGFESKLVLFKFDTTPVVNYPYQLDMVRDLNFSQIEDIVFQYSFRFFGVDYPWISNPLFNDVNYNVLNTGDMDKIFVNLLDKYGNNIHSKMPLFNYSNAFTNSGLTTSYSFAKRGYRYKCRPDFTQSFFSIIAPLITVAPFVIPMEFFYTPLTDGNN